VSPIDRAAFLSALCTCGHERRKHLRGWPVYWTQDPELLRPTPCGGKLTRTVDGLVWTADCPCPGFCDK
jgi:hypothetical protein